MYFICYLLSVLLKLKHKLHGDGGFGSPIYPEAYRLLGTWSEFKNIW